MMIKSIIFKYHFTDLTEQFEQYDFSFDDINDEYSFTMIKRRKILYKSISN